MTILSSNYITETEQPIKIANGLLLESKKVTVALSPSAASFATGITIPTGAIAFLTQLDIPSTISATTAVKIGLGIAADPDKYGLSAALTAEDVGGLRNLATLGIPTTAAEPILVYACDTDGAAAGTIGETSQNVTIRLTWLKPDSL